VHRFSAIPYNRKFIVSSFFHLSAESIIHNVKGALFHFVINACEVFAYEPDCDELNPPKKQHKRYESRESGLSYFNP
jgi:hypothetical protein